MRLQYLILHSELREDGNGCSLLTVYFHRPLNKGTDASTSSDPMGVPIVATHRED